MIFLASQDLQLIVISIVVVSDQALLNCKIISIQPNYYTHPHHDILFLQVVIDQLGPSISSAVQAALASSTQDEVHIVMIVVIFGIIFIVIKTIIVTII